METTKGVWTLKEMEKETDEYARVVVRSLSGAARESLRAGTFDEEAEIALCLACSRAPEYVAFLLIYPWMKEKLVEVAKTPETWSVPLNPR